MFNLLEKLEQLMIWKRQPLTAKPAVPCLNHLLDQWEAELISGRGVGLTFAADSRRKAAYCLAGCSLRTITQARILQQLAALQTGAANRKGWHKSTGLGTVSRNKYLAATKRFLRWCVTHGHLPANPLATLTPLPARNERRRHARRALTLDELGRLIAAANVGAPVQTIPGPDRAVLYATAAWTGLRKAELASLMPENFRLDGDQPTVFVPASQTKGRRDATIPLHPALVEILKPYLATKPPSAFVWPLHGRKAANLMKRDLWHAGIPYCDALGRYADLHSCRHTFISNLAAAGIAVAVTQALARHTDPSLTLAVYTQFPAAAERAAIRALPPPPPPPDGVTIDVMVP